MLKIKNDGKNITVKFSKNLMPEKTLLNFLSAIEMEDIISRSKLTEEDAFKISEEIKESWWKKNKKRILSIVNENNN